MTRNVAIPKRAPGGRGRSRSDAGTSRNLSLTFSVRFSAVRSIVRGDHKTGFGLSADAIWAGRGAVGYVSFHGGRYSRRRNSFGSVTVPPDPLIVLVTRILAPS